MKGNHLYPIIAIALAVISLSIVAQPARALSGAIFTTDKNGHSVNANQYNDKCDVYLDGGPGPQAPSSSAALPPGDYFFQVTDPSGKVLLSTDSIWDRQFSVNAFGVIELATTHPTEEDKDGKEYGAVVVQLCPYDDTPNNGGVYKVWVTRQDDYLPGSGRHGFIPAYSKTDNFKVKKGKPLEQYLIIKKFKDCNANGLFDMGEDDTLVWDLLVTPPQGPVYEDEQTPAKLYVWPGTWTIQEIVPNDTWIQTALIIDGVPQDVVSETATVTFGNQNETHTVLFGNIPTGRIIACKFYDSDADGYRDAGEAGVAGVKMTLTGYDMLGDVEAIDYTGSDGCVAFDLLLPGTYTVTEEVPTNCGWVPTTDTVVEDITLGCQEGEEQSVAFGNVITGTACFSTKGYWHNKNGLYELTDGDITYVNGLPPYSSPSIYFDAGDEPFDGLWEGGLVAPAYNNDKITEGISAGEGTARAEVSHFLVNPNGDGGQREQLAQQLLAFIFNVRIRLGSVNAVILEPGVHMGPAVDLIDDVITAWESGGASEWNYYVGILDGLNNRECDPGVAYVLPSPPPECVPVTY